MCTTKEKLTISSDWNKPKCSLFSNDLRKVDQIYKNGTWIEADLLRRLSVLGKNKEKLIFGGVPLDSKSLILP
jgi:hypothetical protein